MSKLFDLDGPLFGFFTKLASAFWLSVLWVVTSLPIVTIGASNAAIYYILLKILDEKDVKVTKEYFKAFKDNFKMATKIWIPLLGVILVGIFDINICILIGGTLPQIAAILFMCAEILLCIFGLYVFPIMGRFENTIKQTIKNAALMPIKHYICTLWLIVLITLVIVLGIIFPPITLFWPGIIAFVTAYPFHLAFKKYEPDENNPLEKGILPDFANREYKPKNKDKNNKSNNKVSVDNKNSKKEKSSKKKDIMF